MNVIVVIQRGVSIYKSHVLVYIGLILKHIFNLTPNNKQ